MDKIFERTKVKQYFSSKLENLTEDLNLLVAGKVFRMNGMRIEAIGLYAPVGMVCRIMVSDTIFVNAEVIGFSDDISYLMAIDGIDGIKPGTPVVPYLTKRMMPVGRALLGRVMDADGKPIDGLGKLETEGSYPLIAKPINPLERAMITDILDVGIRPINALLSIGKGQRVGIFSGSGVGKSVLLGMMTRYTSADVVVVGLVGERGREVKEFIEQIIGEEGLKKSVVIAAPADTSSIMRANCAYSATSVAEFFRDKGCDVLLIVDSLTRFAQAQREIALSIGEVPTTKGFTPSVYSRLSQLMERSGNAQASSGSITAFYTVLVEGDDLDDPIADHIRSVLDGHIWLSRELAESGHYPAIDIEKSISRLVNSLVSSDHIKRINLFKQTYSSYIRNHDLLKMGMYQAGSDKILDEAIRQKDKINAFLVQNVNEKSTVEDSVKRLNELFG